MDILRSLLTEMEREAQTTRKMLALVPNDKLDWQPHQKSMSLKRLATHVAELPGWVKMALTTDELDFANNPYTMAPITTNQDLLAFFDKSLEEGKQSLQQTSEDELLLPWTLRNGDEIYDTSPKGEVIRMSYCQTVHHRAQLGVYLRLLDIPIPGSYGPSADEMGM
jgi:uncharacterized damage-inducible protein DinB